MSSPKYNRDDFTYEVNSRGYMIQYKGQNIGGAGILNSATGPKGQAAAEQCKDYVRAAESTIDSIMRGNAGHMQKAIDEIEATS